MQSKNDDQTETDDPGDATPETTGYTEPIDLIRTIFRGVERLLSADSPVAVQLSDLEQISEAGRRNLLLRATIADPPAHLPRTLIVKKVVAADYNPEDAEQWDTSRFFKDWAGAALLSQCAPTAAHGPRFYGGDRATGFILLEDMGEEHMSLVEPLLGPDLDHGEVAILSFVERLAHMHVDTHQRAAEFHALVATLHPQLATSMQGPGDLRERIANVIAKVAELGVTTTAAEQNDLESLVAAAADPGPFSAYCHGDPCPDNFFWQGTTLRIMDFEFGHMGHALSDLVYGRMHFPTCWCCNRLPDDLVEAMETRYRAIFAQAYPAILDDGVFGRAMAEVCGITLIGTLNWLLDPALEADREWGITTLRPRIIARLEAFLATSHTVDHLPHLYSWATRLLQALQTSWPDAEALPLYPPFRG